jgi:sec-independent protein translocase protein TatB
MFDIGFPELVLIGIVGLLVLGPERLPGALRSLGLWFGRARRTFDSVKQQIEREVGMDEVHRQLHREFMAQQVDALQSARGEVSSELEPELADRQRAVEAHRQTVAATTGTEEDPSA